MKTKESNNSEDHLNDDTSLQNEDASPRKSQKKKNKKDKKNTWWIKVIFITLVLAAFVSFLSELTAESGNIAVLIVLLFLLVVLSIIFDCIGVAVTSCDETPIISMASRKLYGAKTALLLKKHSSTVSSICNDVIGDIFGIISGTCSAALVVKIAIDFDAESVQRWIAIVFSAFVSAFTIGGKAFMKTVAINKSNEIVMFVAKILALFSKEERKRRKKDKAQSKDK
ncbi:MAG: Mg2+ and Co2+ transporter CorB [Clostridia bacterium]|nr:Mg2+ and Co2+ transporter CorB [Clostridia bacterium]